MGAYTFESLKQRYGGFLAPTVKIELNGKLLDASWRVTQVECSLSVNAEAGSCRVTLESVYDPSKSRFLCENTLVLGSLVTVRMGYVATLPVFRGYLHEAEYLLGEGREPRVELTFLDVKGAMMGCGTLDFTGKKTYKKVIEGFFTGEKKRGYSALCSTPEMGAALDAPVEILPEQMDDYQFLCSAAQRFGLEFFVRENKLLLRKRPGSGAPILELTPGNGIRSLSVRLCSAGYVRSVTVLSFSDNERDEAKKNIKGKAENSYRIAPDSCDAGRLIGQRALEIFSPSVRDDKSALAEAKARLGQRQGLPREVRLATPGLPELTPGSFIRLKKVSPKLDGDFYVASVTHRINQSGFQTDLVGEM